MISNGYEIIILGAGISGLMLGAELSKRHSVLIVEKEGEIPNTKYWLTNSECAERSPNLANCIDSTYNTLDFVAYEGTSYRCCGKYLLWDSNRVIQELTAQIANNGSRIAIASRFYSYKQHHDHISIDVNDAVYTSQILIDCMGYSSPLIYANNILQVKGYYLIHGATVKLKRDIQPIAFHNFMINANPSYLEVFPTSNNCAHAVLIKPVSSISSQHSLIDDFQFLITRSRYSSYFESDCISRALGGIVPVGILKTKALNRIFFYGEAGQINPAASGTCFTILLNTYSKVADFLSNQLNMNALTQKDLNDGAPPIYDKYMQKMQLNLFDDLLRWNSDKFRNFVEDCQDLGRDDFVNDIIFGTLNINHYLNVSFIRTLLRTRNKQALKYFVNALLF